MPQRPAQGLNVALLLGAQLLGAGASFAALAFVARRLGPQEYGAFYLFVAASLVLSQLLDLGLNRTVLPFISAGSGLEGRTVYFQAALRLRITSSAVASALLLLVVAIWPTPQTRAYATASVLSGVLGLQLLYASAFQAEYRFGRLGFVLQLPGTLRLLACLLVFAVLPEVSAVEAAFIGAALLATCASMLISPRWALINGVHIARPYYRTLLRVGGWVLAATFIEAAYQRVDLIWVANSLSPNIQGLYSAALTLLAPLFLLPTAVNLVIFAPLVKAVEERDAPALHRLFKSSTLLLAGLGLPAVGFVVVNFPDVGKALLGPKYLPAWPLAIGLAPYVVLFLIHYNCGALFVALRRPSILFWTAVPILVTTIAGLTVLVPRFGAIGAAASMSLGALSSLIGSWAMVWRLARATPPAVDLLKIMAITCVAVGVPTALQMANPLAELSMRLAMTTLIYSICGVLILPAFPKEFGVDVYKYFDRLRALFARA